jgi:hypothetical protein
MLLSEITDVDPLEFGWELKTRYNLSYLLPGKEPYLY